jgi:hypothetical protein
MLDTMVSELISQKLVDNEESLKSFILNDDELIINGIKQNAEIHQRFKSKYLKTGPNRISFQNQDGFKKISLD